MPKQVDHEQRRQEIISATWQTLAEVGVEGATMRAIADRAGCTTGRLSHYFASRDEILVAALEQVHTAAADRMTAAMRGRDGLDALRRVLLESLPLDEGRRTEWSVWLAFWGRAAVDPALRAENTRRYEQWRDLLGGLVRDAFPHRATVGARRQAVDLLVALIDGLGLQATLDPGSLTPARARRSVDDLLRLLALDQS